MKTFKKLLTIIAITPILLSSIEASQRDITMMRVAVFASALTDIYVFWQDENSPILKLVPDFDKLGVSYLQGKEFNEEDSRYLRNNRLALTADWKKVLIDNSYFSISGHTEFMVNRWYSTNKSSQNQEGYIYAITPMFTYTFKDIKVSNYNLYTEFGIGLAYMDNSMVEDREKSTQFQFADSIGVGFKSTNYQIGYRFTHISNLNIGTPNPSLDFHQIMLLYRF